MIVLSLTMDGFPQYADIADFVLKKLDETRLSEKDVADKAKRLGGDISQGYINDIKNRKVVGDSISLKKLHALALGFSVSLDFLVDIALGRTDKNSNPLREAEGFFHGSDKWSERKKRLILEKIKEDVEFLDKAIADEPFL